MAKLVTMFMILIAIQAALLLYHDQTPQNTDIWTFVTNLDNWNSLKFITTLATIAAILAGVGIAGSTFFGFKVDSVLFAGAIGGLISMGVIFVNLANVLRNELISRFFYVAGCSLGNPCPPVTWIIAITIGPFALYYVWAVVEWWRGKDQ